MFPGLWLAVQFHRIRRQFIDQIDLKLGKQIRCGYPLAWWAYQDLSTFGNTPESQSWFPYSDLSPIGGFASTNALLKLPGFLRTLHVAVHLSQHENMASVWLTVSLSVTLELC